MQASQESTHSSRRMEWPHVYHGIGTQVSVEPGIGKRVPITKHKSTRQQVVMMVSSLDSSHKWIKHQFNQYLNNAMNLPLPSREVDGLVEPSGGTLLE